MLFLFWKWVVYLRLGTWESRESGEDASCKLPGSTDGTLESGERVVPPRRWSSLGDRVVSRTSSSRENQIFQIDVKKQRGLFFENNY